MKKRIAVSMAAAMLTLASVANAGASDHQAFAYSNLEMARPDFDEPFRRDGPVVAREDILRIAPGTTGDQVRTLIGDPIRIGQGTQGQEWDYNLKLGLADEDFIICQYKVIVDGQNDTVIETVWRRYQCRNTMEAVLPTPSAVVGQ